MIGAVSVAFSASLVAGSPSSRGAVAKTWEEAYARMKPWRGTKPTSMAGRVDPASMDGKIVAGYQGWFATPDDGSEMGWVHWGGSNLGPGNLTFEAWPDMSEAKDSEKYPTKFKNADGSTASLFSSYNPDTVDRHFKWMKEYGVHGAFLQRFVSYLRNPRIYDFRTAVTDNVRNAANRHGRTWAVMYDLSGMNGTEADLQMVKDDWKRLVDLMKITADPSYQHHNGKPLVALWGVGFPGRGYNDSVPALVDFIKNDPVYGGNAIMLGTPFGWRDGSRDAKPSPELLELCKKADIVSPWAVARTATLEEFIRGMNLHQKPDIEWCEKNGVDYLPVIFPGFSWHNLMKTRNREPGRTVARGDGTFFWAQGTQLIRAGSKMIYVAMFDEVDEATSIFKITSTPPASEDTWVTNEKAGSDHYLWLSGKLGEALQKGTKPSDSLPERRR